MIYSKGKPNGQRPATAFRWNTESELREVASYSDYVRTDLPRAEFVPEGWLIARSKKTEVCVYA